MRPPAPPPPARASEEVMKTKTTIQTRKRSGSQQGSALLVSLMVMVGLSLLGLGFVAISETESTIAINERNYAQAQAAAEAGAKIAVEWFQDAEWANEHKLLPPNANAIKNQRNTISNGTAYIGRYKDSGGLLFDVPFKISDTNRFFGNENSPDVVLTLGANTTATTFLNKLNDELFADKTVRVTDIRVYAPPMPGGKLHNETAGLEDSGYWEAGPAGRYGVATIRVTAQKLAGSRVVATRAVKLVVTETPFPTVDGAIETSGSLVGQGNFHVYWGKILSEKETQVNRPAVGMPWFDAETQMTFEYGYDSTTQWVQGTAYAVGDVVNAPNSAITTDGDLAKFSYRCTVPGLGLPTTALAGAGFWKKNVGDTMTEGVGGASWIAQPSRPYRVIGMNTDFYTQYNWLYALLDQTIQDPWLHARARGTIVTGNGKGDVPCGNATLPHPCDYTDPSYLVNGRLSNLFQLQTKVEAGPDGRNERLEVFFPTMDYEFWKAVAQAGDNQAGGDLYYFTYNENTQKFVGPGGVEKIMEDWLNARENGLGAGFYFFETENEKNPQYGKSGKLTPAIKINAKAGKNWQMQGYVYMNASAFGTTGAGNMIEDDVYVMPGEPYRDIGYREVDPVTKKYILTGAAALPAANFRIVNAGNKTWNYQDVNDNGVFDWFVLPNAKTLTRPNGTPIAAGTEYLLVPWREGCTVPDLSDMKNPVWPADAVGCSEPHEPYVNIIYPGQNNPRGSAQIRWGDRDDETLRRPKSRLGVNSAEVCKDETSLRDCTSNGYDEDGALVTLAPVLWGALYNEGGYDGSGNAVYYGAVLMRGNFNATGTPEVFFNECLARGCLESQLRMQRVMVTSFETDQ
jgi:hypothetical protein